MKRVSIILSLSISVLSAFGCGNANEAPGFVLTEHTDPSEDPPSRECGSSEVFCFESECIEGRGMLSFEEDTPSALEMRNTCNDTIALHWVTGVLGNTHLPLKTVETSGDYTVPYSFDLSDEHLRDPLNALSLFKFYLQDGSEWDNDPLNRRTITFNYDWQPRLVSQQVMAHVLPGQTIVVEGAPLIYNGDLRDDEGLSAFTQLQEHGLDVADKVEVLIPAVTKTLSPLPEEQVPWPLQLAIDEYSQDNYRRYEHRWAAVPDKSDPRPRHFVSVELGANLD